MIRRDLLRNRGQALLLVAIAGVVLLASLIVVSGYRAKTASDGVMGKMRDPLPHYSTRLALNPKRHMSSARTLSSKPGWIVTYANETGSSAVAFYASFSGNVEEIGDPLLVPHVARHEESVQKAWDAFDAKFVAVDRAITIGMAYEDMVAILGPPFISLTNDGYVRTFYNFKDIQAPKSHQDFITNGFSLVYSNNVLVRKGYSYRR